VLGCGGGASWLGKRRPLQSVWLCWLTLFCRILFMTGGDGSLTLSKVTLSEERALADLVWLKPVPLKVLVFVWRLLRKRLPTKDNLIRRRVFYYDDTLCVVGCGYPETGVHYFFVATSLVACGIFSSLICVAFNLNLKISLDH